MVNLNTAWPSETPFMRNGQSLAGLSTEEILEKASLNWSVNKEPIYKRQPNGSYNEIPGRFALNRADTGETLSVVGTSYKPIQNSEWLEFANEFCQSGNAKIESAGTFNRGKFVYALARLGKDVDIRSKKKSDTNSDQVGGYAVLVQPHVLTYGMMVLATPIRFACFNAMPRLISAAKNQGEGRIFSMSHSRKFTAEVREGAKRILGLAANEIADFRREAQHLADKRASESEVKAYFEKVIRFDRAKAEEAAKAKEGKFREPRILAKLNEALEYAPGSDLSTAKGTWWGAFNAVTYVADHLCGRDDKDDPTQSVAIGASMMGDRALLKRRALDFALKAAA